MTDIDKRMQVAAQCRAIVHLATQIALVHSDKAAMFAAGYQDSLIEFCGDETASLMETLGNILNGMDAVSDEDKWMGPIFEEAHQLWPQNRLGMPIAPDLPPAGRGDA